jgi:signal transduction histidine kinase
MDNDDLLTPEVLVPRLGDQLVQMGLLTEVQLKQALDYQRAQAELGKPRLLGQSLIDLRLLDRSTLDRAITEQILRLRSALEDANRNLENRVKQRTSELEEALHKLSELSQMKANFVANISHELRTPLTHIRGYLELLSTQSLGSLTPDQLKALDVSIRSTGKLQNLIDDLIQFSLASRGELSLQLQAVDLNRVVSAVVSRTLNKAEDKEIQLMVNIDPSLPPVKADEEKISWVFLQLLDNAIKFTPNKGQVTVIITNEDGKMAQVTVSDTGIGIPEERMEEIFEPFHQLDGSPTRKYGGTGLGMALVRQIIEAHGSLVDVKSVVHAGTTISFPMVFAKE